MFLWQKYKYKLIIVEDDLDFIGIGNAFNHMKPEIVAWDTETDGLHIIKSLPFLVGFGFADRLYVFEPSEWRNNYLFDLVSQDFVKYFIAHNAKYDYHMMMNYGTPIPKTVPLADSLALARITSYVDSMDGIGLEALGAKHVNPESKFAGKVIRQHMNEINAKGYSVIKEYVKDNQADLKMTYSNFKTAWERRIQHVEDPLDKHFDNIDKVAAKASYLSSYLERPNLMINYLADDVLLVLEVFKKLIPVLDFVDEGRKTWHRENELIRVVGDMERTGMPIDIEYTLKSRLKVMEYIDKVYAELWEIADVKNIKPLAEPKGDILFNKNHNFSAGQHKVISEIFKRKYKIGMLSTDNAALEEVAMLATTDVYPKEAGKIAELLMELRSLSKWLSTYIEGMLNKLVDGRLYTDINNSGTVTGRVSSDLQQQPNGGLYTKEGIELFHPRKPFINDEGYRHFYFDFSNMEMRVQAYYTMLTSKGDLNMCRAFMPFECYDMLTGIKFDPQKDLDNWNSGFWVLEDGTPWTKLDLHSETTMKAFPEMKPDDEHFKEHRELGKRANFLKNYGGGVNALITQLKVTPEVAAALDKGYYEAFPMILNYQKKVDDDIRESGFTENIYGRRYYFQDSRFSYRGYNYNVQGSCADYVKVKEIELHKLLENYESKMIMPIHDELVFSIKKGEEHLVPLIKSIMENSRDFMTTMPMVSDVEVTDTNWHDKIDYQV